MRRPLFVLALALSATLVLRAAHAQRKSPFWDPPPSPPPPLDWSMNTDEHWLWRTWVAPSAAYLPAGEIAFAGASLGVGLEAQFPERKLSHRLLYGSATGLEGRLHTMSSLGDAPRSWLIAGGLAITSNDVDVKPRALRRVRFPSLAGLIVPEAGAAARSPQPASLYLRWSVPVAVLVARSLAVEIVPALWLLYGDGGLETFWSLGLAISYREIYRPVFF